MACIGFGRSVLLTCQRGLGFQLYWMVILPIMTWGNISMGGLIYNDPVPIYRMVFFMEVLLVTGVYSYSSIILGGNYILYIHTNIVDLAVTSSTTLDGLRELTRQPEKSRQCLVPKVGVLHTHKMGRGMVAVAVLGVCIFSNTAPGHDLGHG